MTNKQAVDTRIDAGWIVPVEPDGVVLPEHSLLIRDGRIVALLPWAQADAGFEAGQHQRLPDHVLIPGLINLHTHAAMTLLRGFADDLPLMTWLTEHIWPAEKRWLSPEFVYDGSRLACLEMLQGGITCFNDMYFFPEAAVQAATEAGQRIAAGIIVIDFPSNYAADLDGYLNKGLALRDAMRDHPLVSFCLAPHAPYSTSDRSLEKVLTYAKQLDLAIHIHIHETHDEIHQSLEQYGVRPIERLRHLGLLGPEFIGVHAIHLLNEEIDLLAEHNCHIAHCPTSNLKLANGVAPKAALLARGINVGIGTDGSASNNRLDCWQEMRLAALLAKGMSGKAEIVPAHYALRMATLNGARALGLDDRIGSLEVGKQADVVAVDLSGPHTQPCYDPISQLVYSAGRQEVSHVWVAGQAVVKDRTCLTLDEAEVVGRAHYWQQKLSA
ncbi:5-methylthioadenosine/S-adenosylhomocysteine deaminase [Sulfuritortus calidifontis]|uniref:5-methylthioadenosine/S-adenosylhomocysteine deaminase n=1 Tax=Sulfuritortus calidifontis TaxID=1914471 RepID=A0A4R3JUT7_9PROT|nr:TRZ/ATZ family hydrolase [Sulfuritortus calidifontis]TCS71579.1 5-methylthioadenosine/S-adenosylhomocysteine deaminase [Sulfuritortus calidifontis]